MLTPAARGLEQEPDATLGLFDPKTVFDIDQIHGRRARTIVNGGFVFCETGP